MDRRSDPTDELYDFAREAYACEDYDQAVYFLRKASALAPMRQDIRLFLAEVLAQSGPKAIGNSPDVVPGEFSTPPIELVRIAEESQDANSTVVATTTSSSVATGAAAIQQSLRRLMQRLPVKAFMGASDDSAELESQPPSRPTARIELLPLSSEANNPPLGFSAPAPKDDVTSYLHRRPQEFPCDDLDEMTLPKPLDSSVSVFAPHAAERTTDEPDFSIPGFELAENAPIKMDPSPTPPANSLDSADIEFEESAPLRTSASSAKRSRRRPPVFVASPEAEKDESVTAEEQSALESATEWLSSMPPPSRRTIVFGAAYLAVVAFLAVSGTQCYRKFLKTPVRPTVAKPAEAAKPAPPVELSSPTAVEPAPSAVHAQAAVIKPAGVHNSSLLEEVRQALALGELDKAAARVKADPAAFSTADGKEVIASLAKAYNQAGTKALEDWHFDQAIANYGKAFGFASSNPVYALHLGNAYYHAALKATTDQEKSELATKAVDPLVRAVELDSGRYEVHDVLGKTYAVMNRYSDARKHWEKALEILRQSEARNGNSVQIQQRIATLCVNLGRRDEERAAYQVILKLAESSSEAAADAKFGLKRLGDQK